MAMALSMDQLERWSSGVAAAASAARAQEISAHFNAAACTLLKADRVYIGLYLREAGASVTIDDRGPDRWNRAYDDRAYRQDPFFHLFADTRGDFLLPLSALDKGDFRRSAYYRDFYAPSRAFDEITGVFNFDANAAGYVTFLRCHGADAFGAEDLALAQVASGAARRILERLWGQWRDEGRRALAPVLPLSDLSARERQIAAMLIEGACAKEIARALSISAGTVRNHIKTVYRKLSVHSHVELMAAARDAGIG